MAQVTHNSAGLSCQVSQNNAPARYISTTVTPCQTPSITVRGMGICRKGCKWPARPSMNAHCDPQPGNGDEKEYVHS